MRLGIQRIVVILPVEEQGIAQEGPDDDPISSEDDTPLHGFDSQDTSAALKRRQALINHINEYSDTN